MMRAWQCTLRVTQHEAKLLLNSPNEGDLLKARLDPRPCHPRALLTMLEGLSLWSGEPLCVALHVDARSPHEPGSMLLGDELWPAESALRSEEHTSELQSRENLVCLPLLEK